MAGECIEDLAFLEYWYMCGSEGYDFRRAQANRARYELDLEWKDEEDRRWESKLPLEEVFLIDMMREEKESGVLWTCHKCDAEYRVRTPFHRLYCLKCLNPLRCQRFLPKDRNKPGYWIFEDEGLSESSTLAPDMEAYGGSGGDGD